MSNAMVRAWNRGKMDYECHDVTVWHGVLVPEGDMILSFWIGLTDGAGKRIYGGDILRGNLPYEKSSEHPLVEILWENREARFIAREINGPRLEIPIPWIKNYQIIGNIYEDPISSKARKPRQRRSKPARCSSPT
jgi:hypothetical protein